MMPPKLQETLDLIVTEITECIAAEQILNGFIRHNDDLARLPPAVHRPWYFVEQAVSWKLALAVNRLLQPGSEDRASLLGLAREVESARRSGFSLIHSERYELALSELNQIRALPTVVALREGRDAFMAHTLLSENRVGISLNLIRDLLERLEPVAEEFYFALTDGRPDFADRFDEWSEWSDAFWDRIFPDEDASRGE